MTVLFEVCVIGVLLLANGFFAAAELSIVAGNRHRLKALADQGNRAAAKALKLAEQPEQVLATVQVGITLIGAFAAAFGGLTIVHALDVALERFSLPAAQRSAISLAIFTIVLTYVQVVIGELIPKRIALANPTRLATIVAPVLIGLQKAAFPLVWLMNRTSSLILRVMPVDAVPDDTKIDLQEIRHLLEAATGQGVLDPVERQVALEALHLGDQMVRHIMTPRQEIDAADVETPTEEVLGVVLMSGFSRLPIYANDLDHVLGYINARDVMLQHYLGRNIELKKLIRPVYFVPETIRLDKLLVELQKRKTTLALVVDEHGRTVGLVTQEDVISELVGEILAPAPAEANIVVRPEGGWLVDGRTSIEEMLRHLRRPPARSPRRVHTVAGLVLDILGRLPQVGEKASWLGLQFEVVDMDGKRIDQLLVTLESQGSGG